MSDIELLFWLFIYATGVTTCVLMAHKSIRQNADGLSEVLFAHFVNLCAALFFHWAWAGWLIYIAKSEHKPADDL